MDSSGKNTRIKTPAKDLQAFRSKSSESSKISENLDPNLSNGSPLIPGNSSPAIKSAKSKKSAPKIRSPRNKIQERKFIVAKKKNSKKAISTISCKCKEKMEEGNLKKCLCVAYESLRASQEDFFQKRSSIEHSQDFNEPPKICAVDGSEEEEKNPVSQHFETTDDSDGKARDSAGSSRNGSSSPDTEENELSNEMGSTKIKRKREKLLEQARINVPQPGSGRVMHLVQAFEKLLSIPNSEDLNRKEENESEEYKKAPMKWALPGLQPKAPGTELSSSSFSPSELFFTSDNFGMDSRVSSSLDSSQGSFSFKSRSSSGTRRSRRNSSESSGKFGGRKWKKKQQQLKATSQQPFKLRTEQRGRDKEEEFFKKVQEMFMEEEKKRIPIAQGLPWTTDEQECLVKPPVKETTTSIDLKLHSDLRAVERAEFDHHVAEKLSFIEQYKLERERRQKLAEEEEIKRLRRELVPRAQPMPYFDRPFIPRRSVKHPTIPAEPKFHIPQHKKIKCIITHQH